MFIILECLQYSNFLELSYLKELTPPSDSLRDLELITLGWATEVTTRQEKMYILVLLFIQLYK